DGTNDKFTGTYAPAGNYVFCGWAYPRDNSANMDLFGFHGTGSNTYQFLRFRSAADLAFSSRNGAAFSNATTGSYSANSGWYILVGWRSSTSNRYIYTSGSSNNATGSNTPAITEITLGNSNNSTANWFFGY